MVAVIGHRGAAAVRRENTVEAFLEAVRLGADGVELDVRRSVDGALVVHHDAVLPGGALISNLPVDELPDWVPTLPEVFDALSDDVFVDVEIKNSPIEPDFDPAEAVALAVADLVSERSRCEQTLITSFSLAAADAVRSADAALRTGWLTLPGYDQLAALATVLERGHHALLPREEGVDAALVDAAHARGVRLLTWTVDDPGRIRELAALDVDGIITNVPDVAVAALAMPGPEGAG